MGMKQRLRYLRMEGEEIGQRRCKMFADICWFNSWHRAYRPFRQKFGFLLSGAW